MANTILIVYLSLMCIILFFCLIELRLAFRYLGFTRNQPTIHPVFPANQTIQDYPFVTIQLPVYNELYVIERLIDACATMDYPAERFEIQVLDDSTDETVRLIQQKVQYWKSKGIQIEQIQRSDRTGFKAGALQYGLQTVKGEFIAIFDADFLPNPDFLQQTIPTFENPEIGVVQTKWEHLNEDYSLLTGIQAFTLDVHFCVEHVGRNTLGYFMNFNGTAGVWRKQTIIEAGGWSADTITEDLDLSYRAQLKGWRFQYLYDVEAPAELPAEINSYKSQQFRWNKGGAEVAIKLLPTIFKTKLPGKIKLHALHHLLSSSMYVIIFMATILSVPLLLFKHQYPTWLINSSSVFFIGFLAIAFVYYLAFIRKSTGWLSNTLGFAYRFLAFMSVSLGMALHNTKAVIGAYLGKKSPFVRTAKYNVNNSKESWKKKKYIHHLDWVIIGEGLLVFYFLSAIVFGFLKQEWGLFPIHVLSFLGYLFVFTLSIKHYWMLRVKN